MVRQSTQSNALLATPLGLNMGTSTHRFETSRLGQCATLLVVGAATTNWRGHGCMLMRTRLSGRASRAPRPAWSSIAKRMMSVVVFSDRIFTKVGRRRLKIHHSGGVCGAVPKFAAGVCQAFGIPSMPVGQPGHCAYIWQRESGQWSLGNDNGGRAKATRHPPVQIPWGNQAWLVPLMQRAQLDFSLYVHSECFRSLAALAREHRCPGSVGQAQLLAQATDICPSNYGAWMDRVECLKLARQSGLDLATAPWVFQQWDRSAASDSSTSLISQFKPVRASDAQERAGNVVDGTGSEWWTGDETAWLEIDLQEAYYVSGFRVQWWGVSKSDTFRVLSTVDSKDNCVFNVQRTQSDATAVSSRYNGWTDVPGWDDITARIRLELADGHKDPWGKNKLFGIRQVVIFGRASKPFCDRVPFTAEEMLKRAAKCMTGDDIAEYVHIACAQAFICERVDGIRVELAQVVSHRKRVRASEAQRCDNVTDGTGSEWWTGQDTAWIEIDLEEPCVVYQIQIQWWGVCCSDRFRVLSAIGDSTFAEQRTHLDAGPVSECCNGWTTIPGFEVPATCVRFELADGHKDTWGKNMLFGIRQILIKGEAGVYC